MKEKGEKGQITHSKGDDRGSCEGKLLLLLSVLIDVRVVVQLSLPEST